MLILDILGWVGIAILILLLMVVGVVGSYLLVALAESYHYRLSHYLTMRAFDKLSALSSRLDLSVPRNTRNDRLNAAVGQSANRVAHAIFMLEKRKTSLQRDNDLRLGACTRKEWKYLRQDVYKVLVRAAFLEQLIAGKGTNDGIWPFNDRLPSFVAPNNYARDRKQWERPECSRRFSGTAALTEDDRFPARVDPVILPAPLSPSTRPLGVYKDIKVVDLASVPRKPKNQVGGVYNAKGEIVPFERPARKVNVRV